VLPVPETDLHLVLVRIPSEEFGRTVRAEKSLYDWTI